MFTVINEFFVTAANRDLFERVFEASMRATFPGVPGLLGARLLQPVEPERGYLSILEFTEESTYKSYLRSDAFRAAHRGPEHAPIESNRLTTYGLTADVPIPE